MKMLEINQDCQVRHIRKSFTLLKHEDILNSMTQTREKWDTLALSRAEF